MRRIGLWAGAGALLFQVLAWAFMPMPALSAAGVLGFCTVDGMVMVAVDADGAPLSPDVPESGIGGHGCPLCPLVSSLAPAPRTDFVGPVTPALTDLAVPAGVPVAVAWFRSTLWPRAPPASIG